MEDSRMKNAVVHNDEPRSNHGWSHGQNQQKSAGDWSYWKFSSILSFLAEVEFFKNSEWLWNANNIQFSFTGSRKTQYDQIQNYDQKK